MQYIPPAAQCLLSKTIKKYKTLELLSMPVCVLFHNVKLSRDIE